MAFAQDEAAAAPEEEGAKRLKTVTITAQKREESLQDVPISVSAIDGDQIVEDGIQRLEDLATYVPNVSIKEGFAGENILVRGFGSAGNPSFEQAVSTFIDGVYFGRSKQSLASFLDLQLVEVLRGPQPTFFGNNAIAGALNLTTKRPGNDMEGYVFSSFNPDDEEAEVTGAVTLPVSDTLSFRLAGKYLTSDGYLTNFGGGTAPVRDSLVGRASMVWSPTDKFEVFLKGEIGGEETIGSTAQIVDCPLGGGAFSPAPSPGRENVGNGLCDLAQTLLPGLSFELDDQIETGGINPQTVIPIADTQINSILAQEGGEFRNLDTENANMTLTYTFDNDVTLTSVTGYSGYESRRQFDVDQTPLASISTNRQEDFTQFSQELRLVSPGGENFDWLAGAYFQTNEVDFAYQTYTLIDSPDGANPGGPPGGNGVHGPVLGLFAGTLAEEQDTWAIFGSGTWNLSDRVRATLGVRYSEVEKDGSNVLQLGLSGNNAAVPVESAAAAVNFFGSPAAPAFIAHNISDSVSSEELTYQVNLQYDFSDAIMGYVSYANGFKAGGFDNLLRLPEIYPTGVGLVPTLEGTPTGGRFTFDQENVDAYEAGLKMEWSNLRVNVAAFHSEFDDLQQSIFNPVAIAFQIDNVGTARSQGIELDGQWAPTDNLIISFAATVLDAEFTEFREGPCDQLSINAGSRSCDLTGLSLPGTPDWSSTLGASHVYPFTNSDLAIFTDATVVFSGDYRGGAENDPRFIVDAHEFVDARIGIGREGGGWRLSVWGKNLTDEQVPGLFTYGAVRSVGPITAQGISRPLSWGVSANVTF